MAKKHQTNLNCFTAGCVFKLLPHGSYTRKFDRRQINRYRCRYCRKTFSDQTTDSTYRQVKSKINPNIRALMCSKVSLRRIAILLNIDRKTVHRRLVSFAAEARLNQSKRLSKLRGVDLIQMDEMETFEHTKCKPLSIALAVIPGKRTILGAFVTRMPSKGSLAAISKRKYGFRPDDRKIGFQSLLWSIKTTLSETPWIITDRKPTYSAWIKQVFPKSVHFRVKGRRGCIVGYGEMKKAVFDPLFYLNHTAAMLRDNIARLLRKTWCTTKLSKYLQDALDVYIDFHNQIMDGKEASCLNRSLYLAKASAADGLIH